MPPLTRNELLESMDQRTGNLLYQRPIEMIRARNLLHQRHIEMIRAFTNNFVQFFYLEQWSCTLGLYPK